MISPYPSVDLANVRFAMTTIDHFLFVPLTIGLAFLTAGVELVHLPAPDLPCAGPRRRGVGHHGAEQEVV
ncbi:MAG: hypothetical protein QOE61_887 [Micromonosporaceae bacterium]|nr:hypothetical protein [Micromonosporaceae bacterium]